VRSLTAEVTAESEAPKKGEEPKKDGQDHATGDGQKVT
jgi:hypothetical protein